MIKTVMQSGDKTVAESIKELRTSQGMSIKDLSTETGFSSAAISRWESGQRTPSIKSYVKVMTALGAELHVVEK